MSDFVGDDEFFAVLEVLCDVDANFANSLHLSPPARSRSLGEIVTTIPTIGFNVETVEYKNISFTVWGE